MQKAVGYNKQKAAELMERYNLDIMVVSNPFNVYYTSGLPVLHSSPNPILEALSNKFPNFSIIFRDGSVTVYNWGAFGSVDEFCWVDDNVPIFTFDTLADTLAPNLAELGLAGKRAGVESSIPKFLLDALTSEEAAMQIVECDDVLNTLRMVKSQEEVQRLVRAMEITQDTINACLPFLKEGLSDNELIRFARDKMLAGGADDWNHFTVRFGDSDPEGPGTGRKIARNEIIRLDFGVVYKGYVSDLNKHAIIGKADEEAKSLLAALVQLQKYCEDNIKPGVNMNDFGFAAQEWYEENYPDSSAYLIGHSIGLQVEDMHLFGTFGGLDIEFEENMVFEIEAWEDYEDTHLGVEDMYIVTKTGCKKLSCLTPDIYEID